MKNQKIKIIPIIICLVIGTIGCSLGDSQGFLNQGGLTNNQVFKIDTSICSLGEAKLYMYTLKNQYEKVYGNSIWQENCNGKTLEDYVKDTVISQLSKIKSMALFAKSNGIELSEDEKTTLAKASNEFYSGLTESEKDFFKLTEEDINSSYSEYLLASKIYSSLTTETNTEVSDDEARVITIQQIIINKYYMDESGNRKEYTEDELRDVQEKIQVVFDKAQNTDDFISLAENYSDVANYEISVGRGQIDENVEKVIFNMENDKLSDIIETTDSYYIIKCVNSYDIEATDANKAVIVEQRKVKAFDEVYEVYIEGLDSVFNDAMWGEVKLEDNPDISTVNYFDIYNQYFE